MQTITVNDAVAQALAEEMRCDSRVLMFGEGVATKRGELLAEFGPGQVLTGAAELAPHLASWFGDETGAALALLRPRDTRETRAMLRAAARLGLGVVPQGGNTGLVGGAIARDAEAHVILSLGRLDRIRSLDPDDYSVVAEAGCILQTVKEAAATRDLFLPVSIGAQGSSKCLFQIIATLQTGPFITPLDGTSCEGEQSTPKGPACTTRQVWRHMVGKGAPSGNVVAQLDYFSMEKGKPPEWFTSVTGAFSERVPDDCQ